jgi:DNA-binding response OmpR family regulator
MHKILLVEDSIPFQKIIIATLGHHQVICASSVAEALDALKEQEFELILLDIHLPDRDGYSLLSELQSDLKSFSIPVICLTGKNEVTDKVTAFSLGADDYIVKPFDPIELKARVEGKLKKSRRSKETMSVHFAGPLEIDHRHHRVTLHEGTQNLELSLTQTEFKLLSHLATHPDQVLTRSQLLMAAWGKNTNVLERVVDVHLCSLRKKLGSQAQSIKALPGVGYKFVLPSTPKKRVS